MRYPLTRALTLPWRVARRAARGAAIGALEVLVEDWYGPALRAASTLEEVVPMPPEQMEISAADLKPLVEEQSVQVVDVRESFELSSGVIPGAIHVPLGLLPQKFRELPTDKPLVIYCAHGVRSFNGAAFLRQQGIAGVRSLAGGIVAWAREGGVLG